MKLLSVNVGKARPIAGGKKIGKTGIFKQPVLDAVRVTRLGIQGDEICDVKNHGGVDQAVYIYGAPDYAWWSDELGRELQPGTFGENLTFSELESASAQVGDRLHIGPVILEVTSPRIPCVTLAARMGDPSFAKRFRYAERPGLYCRVIEEGEVRAGDAVVYQPHSGETVEVIQFFRDFFLSPIDTDAIRRYLAAPIDIRSRIYLEKQLAERLDSAAYPSQAD